MSIEKIGKTLIPSIEHVLDIKADEEFERVLTAEVQRLEVKKQGTIQYLEYKNQKLEEEIAKLEVKLAKKEGSNNE